MVSPVRGAGETGGAVSGVAAVESAPSLGRGPRVRGRGGGPGSGSGSTPLPGLASAADSASAGSAPAPGLADSRASAVAEDCGGCAGEEGEPASSNGAASSAGVLSPVGCARPGLAASRQTSPPDSPQITVRLIDHSPALNTLSSEWDTWSLGASFFARLARDPLSVCVAVNHDSVISLGWRRQRTASWFRADTSQPTALLVPIQDRPRGPRWADG